MPAAISWLSPDGAEVVYVANNRLYKRAVDGREAVLVPGVVAGGARNPFYSPDGRWIGFWQDRQLKKISSIGGSRSTPFSFEAP